MIFLLKDEVNVFLKKTIIGSLFVILKYEKLYNLKTKRKKREINSTHIKIIINFLNIMVLI